MSFLSLPEQTLIQVILNLELRDLLALGDCHSRLRDLVYKTPEIWTSNLLFPTGDSGITDKFTQRIIPRITRHYGILALKMMRLPLTWTGYFMIFDQFAHSVKFIQIDTGATNLRQLVHHLGMFAGNLAMLQQSNRIPITFRQYAFGHKEYTAKLADSNYLGQGTLHSLIDQFAQMQLDDPPFERLQAFDVANVKDQDQHLIKQLESLTYFLSGRAMNDLVVHSPQPNTVFNNSNKRQRDDLPHAGNKQQRHETRSQPQHSHSPYTSHQQQQRQHIIASPHSTATNYA